MANALHKDQTGVDLHEPKDVAAALVDLVYVTNGAGSGDFKFFKPNNVVLINVMSDFPTAVAGVRTLVADTHYKIGADVSTADRFALSANVSISCSDTNGPTLTYTGTDPMFTGTAVNFNVYQARLNAANATLVDMTSGFFRLDNSTIEATTQDGKFTDMVGVVINRCSYLASLDGNKFFGSVVVGIYSQSKTRYITTSATNVFVDFGTAVFNLLEVTNIAFTAPAGAIGLKGLAASGNLGVGKLAVVADVSFSTAMTPLSGIVPDDIRWVFQANAGVANSIKAADTFITSTQTVTIVTSTVFVAIGGTSWTSDIAASFTTDIAGKLTYINELDATFLVGGIATIEKTAGGTDVLEMRIAKNGTTLAKSGSFTETATPATVSSQILVSLTKDDTLQLFVANNSSTGNVDVNVANLTARASG